MTDKNTPNFRSMEQGLTIADFIKLEYESVISVIERLNNQKLSYQKLYIGLITVVGSVSIALLKLKTETADDGLKISHLIGFLQVLTTLLGFGVIRNMSASRLHAVMWTKRLGVFREIVMKQLSLPSNYPSGKPPRAGDRSSSDYITIITCSLVNLLLLISAITFLFYSGGPLQLSVTAAFAVAVYVFLHCKFIEAFLRRNDNE